VERATRGRGTGGCAHSGGGGEYREDVSWKYFYFCGGRWGRQGNRKKKEKKGKPAMSVKREPSIIYRFLKKTGCGTWNGIEGKGKTFLTFVRNPPTQKPRRERSGRGKREGRSVTIPFSTRKGRRLKDGWRKRRRKWGRRGSASA